MSIYCKWKSTNIYIIIVIYICTDKPYWKLFANIIQYHNGKLPRWYGVKQYIINMEINFYFIVNHYWNYLKTSNRSMPYLNIHEWNTKGKYYRLWMELYQVNRL